MYDALHRTHEPHRYLVRPCRYTRPESAWTKLGRLQDHHATVGQAVLECVRHANGRTGHFHIEVQS